MYYRLVLRNKIPENQDQHFQWNETCLESSTLLWSWLRRSNQKVVSTSTVAVVSPAVYISSLALNLADDNQLHGTLTPRAKHNFNQSTIIIELCSMPKITPTIKKQYSSANHELRHNLNSHHRPTARQHSHHILSSALARHPILKLADDSTNNLAQQRVLWFARTLARTMNEVCTYLSPIFVRSPLRLFPL